MARYLPAAVACENLTLADGIPFFDKFMRLVEETKTESFHFALVYEALEKHGWQERAESPDPDLDIAKECKVVEKVLMATARTRLTPTLREEEIGQANGSVSDGAAVAQVEAGDATRSRHGSGVDAVRALCTLLGHPAGGPQTHQFELASYLYQTHTVVPAHSGCAHGSHVSACARNGDALSSTYSQT